MLGRFSEELVISGGGKLSPPGSDKNRGATFGKKRLFSFFFLFLFLFFPSKYISVIQQFYNL